MYVVFTKPSDRNDIIFLWKIGVDMDSWNIQRGNHLQNEIHNCYTYRMFLNQLVLIDVTFWIIHKFSISST